MSRFLALVLALSSTVAAAGAADWTTEYERSGFRSSPDYTATVDYCRRLAAESPWINYTTFGESPQGRALPLVVVDRDGNFDPASVRATDNVVVLIQAGIHAGEIDGKDAGLMLIRDIAITRERNDLLDGITILFIPVFNVDGHERRSPYGRANQNGPDETGWRVTAQNLNLNRDYLKADAPEMRAWLRLYSEWLPEFFVDCHVTDGADYRYVVTYAAEQYGTLDEHMTTWLKERFLAPLHEGLEKSGIPVALYQWYRRYHDPRSGIRSWMATPRLSEGYCAEQNRPGLLVETHSLKDYRTRVDGTYTTLVATLRLLSRERGRLRELVAAADARVASPAFRNRAFPLQYAMSETDSVMVTLHGYDYTMIESDVSGGAWPLFTDRPADITVPYFHRQVATVTVLLPEGYIVPPQWTDVIERLEMHGVMIERTGEPHTVNVESYRFENVVWEATPTEGRHRCTFDAVRAEETRTYPAGSVVIDMNQRAARVAAHILEPDGPDSFVSWGFFDAIMEQKEYIESYVIEPLAREMLDGDAGLRAEFESWRAGHADADPATIREWFYRRSPYYDRQFKTYPVGRILSRTTLERLRG